VVMERSEERDGGRYDKAWLSMNAFSFITGI
jgi:hypothetical protein